MVALAIDEVHGPADVINGIPLNVATPFSSVKRCCAPSNNQKIRNQDNAKKSERRFTASYKRKTKVYRCYFFQLFLLGVKDILRLPINPIYETVE